MSAGHWTPLWVAMCSCPCHPSSDGPNITGHTAVRLPMSKGNLAASYQALHDAYRQRETVFATVMTDRTDWDNATGAQRHLAVAADARAEIR